jgi:hypothetical protein
VTPRMHGIHHSVVRGETDSNWSSGLSVWDWLHRTLKLNVPQLEITIGVPGFQSIDDVGLPKMLALPFEADARVAGDDEDLSVRPDSCVPPTLLMP